VRYLLDTHAWHWAAIDDPRLSPVARELINDRSSLLGVSAISLWELKVHVRRGRITLEPEPDLWMRQSLASMSVEVYPITGEIAALSESLEGFGNLDPADRFIAATAQHLGLTLVSADRVMHDWGKVPVIW